MKENTFQGGSMGFFRVNTYLIYLVFARPYENAKTKHVHWRKMYCTEQKKKTNSVMNFKTTEWPFLV